MPFDRITTATTDTERFARLRLARTERVGPVNFANLMQRFGNAMTALDALPAVVGRSGGKFTAAPEAKVHEELKRGEAIHARLLLAGDSHYPSLLAQIDAAPPVLWSLGPGLPLNRRAAAIVGARNASAAGQTLAQQLARELGEAGFTIVSGLARGIDTRAHTAALTSGTVAVLGGGIDDVYPPENAALYKTIGEQGLILSESPVSYTAQARDFPRRNRIISGLSLATIVVEAELRSGSLITARLAAEQNRDVFAVPGSPLDPRARGCNDLLRQGAHICENAEDVIRALDTHIGFESPGSRFTHDALTSPSIETDIASATKVLLQLTSPVPMGRDELVRLSGFPAFVALCALSELEIAGKIDSVPGGGYVRS